MVVLNYTGEEINAKIVYYGPGLSGKTTNLEFLYGQMPADSKGQMVSMKTRTDRTLFFDFFPLELGEISGYRTRLLLYTVPGQVYYNATRKLVLKGADAVVFVADSAPDKLQENIESLRNLEDNLNEHGLTLDNIPWVIQYNKRDLADCMPVPELHQHLNLMNVPAYEAVAVNGHGVYETFKEVAGLLYRQLKEKLERGDVIVSQGMPGDELLPHPAGEQRADVNTSIDSALRELGGGRHLESHPAPDVPPVPPAVPRAAAPRSSPPSHGPGSTQPVSGTRSRRTGGDDPQEIHPPRSAPPGQSDARQGNRRQARPDTGAVPNHSNSLTFTFAPDQEPSSPDIGRLVELDEPAEGPELEDDAADFITDPMRTSGEGRAPQAEPRNAPVATERQPAPIVNELVVPVVVSRSQVRKTIPLTVRLEITVVDD